MRIVVRYFTSRLVGFLVLGAAIYLPVNAYASICDSAAKTAAAEIGIPANVMFAITRVETGRRRAGSLEPWPWAINVEGQGEWLKSKSDAVTVAAESLSRGETSFDVGCFQLNYRWHGTAFSDLHAMYDPVQNARYAAKFLRSLYAEFGTWEQAAGAYHSRTPHFAQQYQARFKTILANLPDVGSETHEPERTNAFPLLLAGRTPSGMGSLVPVTGATLRPFWGP